MRAFTEQSREDVVRSIVNNSTSKYSWSFSKQKRFKQTAPNCPYIAYAKNNSVFSNKKALFGSSRRKVFTETSEAPSPWLYHPSIINKHQTVSFGAGRQQAIAFSYIPQQNLKHPGVGKYELYQNCEKSAKSRGYTVRPKTANSRTYFIENKQQQEVPGPGKYDLNDIKVVGRNSVSKYRTSTYGSMPKSHRFKTDSTVTPSSAAYEQDMRRTWSKGSRMGSANRKSFIDVAKCSDTPGPGNYKIPCQFGHYKKLKTFY